MQNDFPMVLLAFRAIRYLVAWGLLGWLLYTNQYAHAALGVSLALIIGGSEFAFQDLRERLLRIEERVGRLAV